MGRGIGRIWTGAAHLAGGAARGVGKGARGLEPEMRRDGLGLSLIALAIIMIAATWFGVDGWFISWTSMLATAFFGALSWLVPLLLLALAWRFLRHPDQTGQPADWLLGSPHCREYFGAMAFNPGHAHSK